MVYHLLVNNNNKVEGRGLINFLPLKKEGLLETGAHSERGVYREFFGIFVSQLF